MDTSKSLQEDKTEFNQKAMDILLKYLEQTLKSVDTSLLLAFMISAFLLIPGLEGTFSVEAREEAIVEIPYLNLKAKLVTSALFGLVLYWIFCFRAAFQVLQGRKIINKLKSVNIDVLGAALHFPSITTSGINYKRVTCAALALLGMTTWILIYISPLGLENAIWGAPMMAIPPAYLYYVMSKPFNSSTDNK